MQKDIYDRIIEVYDVFKSIKGTADHLGISEMKVRKVLITEGLWSSETSLQILAMHQQGMTTEEIAEKLNYTVKNVQAFLPYTRGLYGGEKGSSSSARSKEYRERKQNAAQHQVGSKVGSTMCFKHADISNAGKGVHYGKCPIALKLHLELDIGELSAKQMDVLQKYGKVKNGISRDIIVPCGMTLHALHYAIQKLFGWQNSHLHHFAFPNDVFKNVTQDNFARWCRLCGVYFRFPNEDMSDLFWDDDYEPTISFKSWLKGKYTGPYQYYGTGDYYLENQRLVREFKKSVQTFPIRGESRIVSVEKATVDEAAMNLGFESDMNYLLERLNLMDYLLLPNTDYQPDSLDHKIEALESDLDTMLDRWVDFVKYREGSFDEFCELAILKTVSNHGQSQQLDYYYDYGSGWKVTITCTDVYYNDCEDETINKVASKYSPKCIESDGFPVLDDVMGVEEYIRMLVAIYDNPDSAKADEAYNWAKKRGWTGRMANPSSML